LSVEDFVETVLAHHPHDVIPVTSDDEVVGAAGFKQVREIPRAQWRATPLKAIAIPLSELAFAEASIAAGLPGMLTLSDLAAHLRFRADLAEAARAP
jgi:hypothetical protein